MHACENIFLAIHIHIVVRCQTLSIPISGNVRCIMEKFIQFERTRTHRCCQQASTSMTIFVVSFSSFHSYCCFYSSQFIWAAHNLLVAKNSCSIFIEQKKWNKIIQAQHCTKAAAFNYPFIYGCTCVSLLHDSFPNQLEIHSCRRLNICGTDFQPEPISLSVIVHFFPSPYFENVLVYRWI